MNSTWFKLMKMMKIKRMKNIGIFLLAGLFGLSAFGTASADMGQIHVSAQGVSVSEPAQKAIVLYNGVEEVLILETDIKATKETGILRFLPLPSEPAVELAPGTSFTRVGELVRNKDLKIVSIFQSKGGPSTPQGAAVVEAISHKKLGSHDLTVIKVNDADHFKEWVRKYFQRNKLGNPGKNAALDPMVRDYVKRGINWFAFDFVKVNANDTSVAPLAYRFQTKKVYYPLLTSNSVGGQGKVQLFFLAPNALASPVASARLNSFPRIDPTQPVKFDRFRLSTYAALRPEEASGVYPGAGEFFEDQPVVLQCATYTGRLSFAEDVHLALYEHYNPAQEKIPGGDPGKLKQDEESSPETIFQQGGLPWRRGLSALEKAERAEYEHRSLATAVLQGSLFVSSTGRTMKLKDGSGEDGGVRVEVRLIAVGDLDGDARNEAAVLVDVTRDGKTTCELSVLRSRDQGGVVAVDEPGSGATLSLDRTGFRTMSVSDGKIRLKAKGTAPMNFAIRGGKLERIAE